MKKDKKAQYYVRGMAASKKLIQGIESDCGEFESKMLTRKGRLTSTAKLVEILDIWIQDAKSQENPYANRWEMRDWLDGIVGLSTSLYNPGQKYYFSPMGYIFKFTEEKSVIANFCGDGTIGTGPFLKVPLSKHASLQVLCNKILECKAIDHLLGELKEKTKSLITPKDYSLEMASDIIGILKNLAIACEKEGQEKVLLETLTEACSEVLSAYCKVTGSTSKYSGAGFNTDEKFNEARKQHAALTAEQAAKTHGGARYTECVIQATAQDLESVFASLDICSFAYSGTEGGLNIPGDAKQDVITDILKGRMNMAMEIHAALQKANPEIKFSVLDDQGKIYIAKEVQEVENLKALCNPSTPDWHKNLISYVHTNFTLLDEPALSQQIQSSSSTSESEEAEEEEEKLLNVSSEVSGAAIPDSLTQSYQSYKETMRETTGFMLRQSLATTSTSKPSIKGVSESFVSASLSSSSST